MNIEEFKDEIIKLGLDIDNEKLDLLDKYYNLLIEWNDKINLTAINKREDVYLKHFYDSLTLAKVVDLNSVDSFCDIGSGAGFPGMVIKIFFPHLKLTLIDSLNKRTNFLKIVSKELNLSNVDIIHARAEEYGKVNRELFDVVTARAVSSFNVLLEYCIPLVKKEKYFIAMRGQEESNNYERALKDLSSSIEKVEKFNLPIENSARTIYLVKKNDITMKKYPRRFSEIKKNPL